MELLDQTNLLEEEILKKFNSEINSILRITRSFERTPSVNEFDHITDEIQEKSILSVGPARE